MVVQQDESENVGHQWKGNERKRRRLHFRESFLLLIVCFCSFFFTLSSELTMNEWITSYRSDAKGWNVPTAERRPPLILQNSLLFKFSAVIRGVFSASVWNGANVTHHIIHSASHQSHPPRTAASPSLSVLVICLWTPAAGTSQCGGNGGAAWQPQSRGN